MRSIILTSKIRQILTNAIILLAFFLRVFHLNDIAIEEDELLSVTWFIRDGLFHLLTHNTELNNHPLNSLLAYLMSYGNMLAFTLRWHSVLFGVLAVAGMMALSKRWFRRNESLLVGLFMAISAYYVPLSQIERGYGGLVALTILSAYFLDRALLEKKLWAYFWFVICVAFNIYFHLYGVMAAGTIAVVLTIRVALKQGFNVNLIQPILRIAGIVLCGFAIAVLLYLPMLPGTLEIAGGDNRFREKDLVNQVEMTALERSTASIYPTIRRFSFTAQDRRLRVMDPTFRVSPVDSIAVLADTSIGFYLALFSALLGFLFWRGNPNTALLIVWLVLPFLVQAVADYIVPGAYYRGRFMAFVYPAYLMLMLRGWLGISDWLGNKWIGRFALSFLLLINVTWLFAYYQASVQGGWQDMADYFAKNRQTNDLITCGQRSMIHCNNDPETRLAIPIEEVDKLIDIAYFEQHQAELQQAGRVWLIMPYLKQAQISHLAGSQYDYVLYGSPPYDQSGWILFDKHSSLAGNIFDMLAYRSKIALTITERENSYLTLLDLYLAEKMYPQAEQVLNEARALSTANATFEQSLTDFARRLEFEQQATAMTDSLPVNATVAEQNFVHFARLVGYDVSTTTVKVGQELTTTLYWLPLTYIDRPLAIYVNLTDLQANVLVTDNQIPTWKPGRLAEVEFKVTVPPDLPSPYALRLEAGLFDVDNSQFINSESGAASVILADLTYSVDRKNISAPSNRQEVIFDEAIRMLGYDISPATLTLYWQVEKELAENYVVFVHILNEKGELVGQVDGEPFAGHYPTSWWSSGQIWGDVRHLPQLEAGQYQLNVGWYRYETGERLSARGVEGTTWSDQSVSLGWFTVE